MGGKNTNSAQLKFLEIGKSTWTLHLAGREDAATSLISGMRASSGCLDTFTCSLFICNADSTFLQFAHPGTTLWWREITTFSGEIGNASSQVWVHVPTGDGLSWLNRELNHGYNNQHGNDCSLHFLATVRVKCLVTWESLAGILYIFCVSFRDWWIKQETEMGFI